MDPFERKKKKFVSKELWSLVIKNSEATKINYKMFDPLFTFPFCHPKKFTKLKWLMIILEIFFVSRLPTTDCSWIFVSSLAYYYEFAQKWTIICTKKHTHNKKWYPFSQPTLDRFWAINCILRSVGGEIIKKKKEQ